MVRVTAVRVCPWWLVLLFHDSTPRSFGMVWVAGWNTKYEALSQKGFSALPAGGAVRHTVGS